MLPGVTCSLEDTQNGLEFHPRCSKILEVYGLMAHSCSDFWLVLSSCGSSILLCLPCVDPHVHSSSFSLVPPNNSHTWHLWAVDLS